MNKFQAHFNAKFTNLELGTAHLLAARKALGTARDIHIETMHNGMAPPSTMACQLTDEQAVGSDRFDFTLNVFVNISDGGLDKYMNFKYEWKKEQTTWGYKWYVETTNTFDMDKVLKDWLAAGAPLEWDPEWNNTE